MRPRKNFFSDRLISTTFAGGYRGLALARFEAAETFQRLDLNEAQTSAEKAHTCLGYALLARGEHQSSVAKIKRALSMSPNLAFAHGQLGAALLFSCPSDEAIAISEQAFGHCQLNGPRAPFCGPARLEQGSTIGEQRTFRPEPPRHRHNEHTTGS